MSLYIRRGEAAWCGTAVLQVWVAERNSYCVA
jgi:hypothetical protein